MLDAFILVALGVALALLFDFVNGFHDAANSIATIVTTGVLTPHQAVGMAAIANFIGAFVFSLAIAETIGAGIINPDTVSIAVILAALSGAVVWNIFTWILGLPTSSSHALVGGLIGSAIAKAGFSALNILGITKTVVFIFAAPLIGLLGAAFFTIVVMNAFRKFSPRHLNGWFRKLQLVSAFFYSLGHGTNDAQKTMGIIAVLMFSAGMMETFSIPLWVVLSCHAVIALGTYLGGWRIVKTMGTKITKLHPVEGFCAETSSGIVLLLTAHAGIPVSTTHVIAGSIMGVGAVENSRKVRWVTARTMVWAWILTIPVSAGIAAASYYLLVATIA